FMTGAIYMIGPLSNIIFQDTRGELALTVAGGNVDLVVPILINEMMLDWFFYLFTLTSLSAVISIFRSLFHVQATSFSVDVLTALSAVISPISSLMHVQAISFSEDIFKTLGITSVFGGKISLVRFGVIIGVVAAVILAYIPPGGVIAQATSFWFGICAAGFLP